jgi:methylated-DNA-[protein]-cysteine S-methyltransferase
MDIPVAWTATLPGPWGPLHVAVTRRAIVAVAWLTTVADFEASLSARLRGPVMTGERGPDGQAARLLERAAAALGAVLAGREPERLPVDLHDRPDWDRMVLAEVREIRLGTTAGYGEIARRIGRPGAARAVGGAVGRNPISLLIPCHRVIAGDGSLGGYGGDAWGGREERLEIKRDLLRREGISVGRRPR